MKRQIDINEISDGKKYTHKDMVRLGCSDCEGCSACCRDMESTVLDPWDIWQLTGHLQCSFEQLLEKYVELRIADGLILPHLKMDGRDRSCHFLNEAGRCSIHKARPGVCRLFPLGRLYEGDGFSYFLQIYECRKENRSKVKIEKWLGIAGIARYEAYIIKWHDLLKQLEEALEALDDSQIRTLQMFCIRTFFSTPYTETNFYAQFDDRYRQFKSTLGME